MRWVEGLEGKFWREKRGGVSLGRMTEHAVGVAKWRDLCQTFNTLSGKDTRVQRPSRRWGKSQSCGVDEKTTNSSGTAAGNINPTQ